MPEALITMQLGQPHVLFQDNGDPGRSSMFVFTRGNTSRTCIACREFTEEYTDTQQSRPGIVQFKTKGKSVESE